MTLQHSSSSLRILVIHNALSPYRLALFREITRISGHRFKFLFTEPLSGDRLWEVDTAGIHMEIIDAPRIRIGNKKLQLWFRTERFRDYDRIVLNDHLTVPGLLALGYARARKIPTLLWTANTLNALGDLPGWQIPLKGLITRLSSNFLVPGSMGREYIHSLGIPQERIHVCNNVVDNTLFARARQASREEKQALREKLGLRGPVLLYCGQFIRRKGLDTLMEALDGLNKELEFTLLALGSGPLGEELRARFPRGANRRLVIPGFVQPSEIHRYYAVSDIFVLPAHIDTWGMVVNEAMAAGVPPIVSTGAGAHADMVSHGKSGFHFEKGDAAALAGHLERLITDRELRAGMVREGDRILERFTLEHAARQFIAAVEKGAPA